MKEIHATHESPTTPSVLAIFAGGGALAWMTYQNGFEILRHWFFYPSLLFFGLTCLSLIAGIGSSYSKYIWTFCMWWSGIWTLIFVAAFAIPPFSMLIVGSLVSPILEAGRIGPFSAGFLHLVIWACAKDVVNHINIRLAEQAAVSNHHQPPSSDDLP